MRLKKIFQNVEYKGKSIKNIKENDEVWKIK